jgi:hypothetical protein
MVRRSTTILSWLVRPRAHCVCLTGDHLFREDFALSKTENQFLSRKSRTQVGAFVSCLKASSVLMGAGNRLPALCS